ncbi:MAG: hypothetical protein BWX92_01233 [Deltaproteobacteria bacterium ADurb.Bin135]|jgi:hypothetical protein|nr:MAG: hypothetical protein BWX92_01233 [Deltaproteobacteria bacterium ADurb.Bin135]
MCNSTATFIVFVTSSILLWYGYTGLRSNRVCVKGGYYIDRFVSPINYWLNVGVYLVVGIGGLCSSLLMIWMR